LKAFQAARGNPSAPKTPPLPPKKENYEANPNNGGDSSEDFEEILHFIEDANQAPNYMAGLPNLVRWMPEAGLHFSAPGGTGFSLS